MLEVLGLIHRGHASLAQYMLDAIAIGQRLPHPIHLDRGRRHRATRHTGFGGRGVAAVEAEMRRFGQRSVARRTRARFSGHWGSWVCVLATRRDTEETLEMRLGQGFTPPSREARAAGSPRPEPLDLSRPRRAGKCPEVAT